MRMKPKKLCCSLIILLFCFTLLFNIEANKANRNNPNEVEFFVLNSPPTPPTGRTIIEKSNLSKSTVILSNVPTSEWTYGCTATSAGMLFGYYDRTGYSNMYTGSTNSGVCPISDLGQATPTHPDYPNPGSCYIIATEQGLDGISTKAHVDDYWISTGSSGPDPWEGNWAEHSWKLCVADFLGTSQWKWDRDLDGVRDHMKDGATTYWTNPDGSKLYDYIPDASQGLPQTACCHGCKLFAESRGYSVVNNYNQLTNTPNGHPSGFTFNDFMAEINAARPVITHWSSSSSAHTMLGVGYDSTTNTIYFHDTWDNSLHSTTWTGTYSSYNLQLKAVTVIELAPSGNTPPSFGSPSPPNGAIHQPLSFTWQIPINDADNNQINWTIECSNGQINGLDYDTNGVKTLSLSGLSYGITYTIWVDASDVFGSGQSTSETFYFTTIPNAPSVSTNPATNIQSTSAQLNGYLSDLGGANNCDVWFVWDTTAHSNWQDYAFDTSTQNMNNPGSFNDVLTVLDPNTIYHYRAVSTNSGGTSQGIDQTFTTLMQPPSVSTNPATNIQSTSAQLNGYLSDLGGANNCDVWFVWDITSHDAWQEYAYDSTPQVINNPEYFQEILTDLDFNASYYFRAVASNSVGTSQGQELIITRKVNITMLSQNWNFISIPFNHTIDKNDIMINFAGMNYSWSEAVSLNIISDYIFGWNRSGQYYTFSNMLKSGFGYWVFSYENCDLLTENVSLEYDELITETQQNWNTIGIIYDSPVEKDDILVNDQSWNTAVSNGWISDYIFGWNPLGQHYIFTDTLNPGYSYWVYASQPCTLKRSI